MDDKLTREVAKMIYYASEWSFEMDFDTWFNDTYKYYGSWKKDNTISKE